MTNINIPGIPESTSNLSNDIRKLYWFRKRLHQGMRSAQRRFRNTDEWTNADSHRVNDFFNSVRRYSLSDTGCSLEEAKKYHQEDREFLARWGIDPDEIDESRMTLEIGDESTYLSSNDMKHFEGPFNPKAVDKAFAESADGHDAAWISPTLDESAVEKEASNIPETINNEETGFWSRMRRLFGRK